MGVTVVIIRRFPENPIIRPDMDERMGSNINGPSLVRVPEWLPGALGRYYLYFADHRGDYIRLAYADDLAGPWRMHTPGCLELADSFFDGGHLASPDVHVDEANRQLRMYYHGAGSGVAGQWTRVAISGDGLRFVARPEMLGVSYFRAFQWDGWHYALAMPGILYRSRDGLTGFEQGPTLFTPAMRHSAVAVRGHTLWVFYTDVGDCPESILLSSVDLRPDWQTWRPTPPELVLQPEMEYEGAGLTLEASRRGRARARVRQLRDPAIYQEDGRTYLLYAVAGESGIAIAEVQW